MYESLHFCLSGYGRLNHVLNDKGKMVAYITSLQFPLSEFVEPDEIILKCDVEKPNLILLLQQLKEKRSAEHIIIVDFRAAYHRFDYLDSMGCPNDPVHVLGLRCKLLQIKAWYQDGQSMTET